MIYKFTREEALSILKSVYSMRGTNSLSDCESTPLPEELAPLPQRKHECTAYNCGASQQADAAVDSNALEHWPREQDRGEGEQTPRKAVGREDARSVSWVDVRNV